MKDDDDAEVAAACGETRTVAPAWLGGAQGAYEAFVVELMQLPPMLLAAFLGLRVGRFGSLESR